MRVLCYRLIHCDHLTVNAICYQLLGTTFSVSGNIRRLKSLFAPNSLYSNTPHTVDDLKMAITEYIRNVDRAILNTVFENTVRRVNKCLETGGGHFEHYL